MVGYCGYVDKITPRQKELLKLIYRFIKTEGFPPSFEDIKAELKISSNQTVLDHLKNLEKKGFIDREAKSARSIKIKSLGFQILDLPILIPALGTSYAGQLATTFPQVGIMQPLNGDVSFANDTFTVEISGDSMIEAGIYPRDHLLAKTSSEFVNRDIVVAQVGDATTVKRFVTQNRPPERYLKPENKKYDIILFTNETKMQAKIIGKYHKEKIIPINQKTKSFI